jgi:hypothetical protein
VKKQLRSVSIKILTIKRNQKVRQECSKETARISFYLMWGKGIGGTACSPENENTSVLPRTRQVY